MNKKWSPNIIAYLKEHVGALTDSQLADNLTKLSGQKYTMYAVRRKRQKLGLKKIQGGKGCSELSHETISREMLKNI